MSTANRGMSDIKTIREALEDLALESVYSKGVASKALAALSRLAEPEEDARELVKTARAWTPGEDWPSEKVNVFRFDRSIDEAAALIERYVAAQVAKAHEGALVRVCKSCAAKTTGRECSDEFKARCSIRAAIKEAPDGR